MIAVPEPFVRPIGPLLGYDCVERRVPFADREFVLVGPASCDALLDEPRVVERFRRDEYMPYWADCWPAALWLATVVAAWERPAVADAPPRVLELGAGLGLVGLVAHAHGYDVTISDYEPDALAFVAESARRSGLPPVRTLLIDWREAQPGATWERILGVEVLYERRNLSPIARFIAGHLTPTGSAWLCDSHRKVADGFPALAIAAGLDVREQPTGPPGPTGAAGRLFVLGHQTGGHAPAKPPEP